MMYDVDLQDASGSCVVPVQQQQQQQGGCGQRSKASEDDGGTAEQSDLQQLSDQLQQHGLLQGTAVQMQH
jgi:hypothetical protein